MPLGKDVGLGPGDLVLDGDPALPPQKGGGAPIFVISLELCTVVIGLFKFKFKF